MANTVSTTFTTNGTIAIPAGVTQVQTIGIRAPRVLSPGANLAFLDSFGNLYSSGANSSGQLGISNVTPGSTPTGIDNGGSIPSFIRVEIDSNSTASTVLALTSQGRLFSWGLNINGQLGNGNVTPRSSAVAVNGLISFYKMWIAQQDCYALTELGQLYCWGINISGELGINSTTPTSNATAVVGGLLYQHVAVNPVTSGNPRSALFLTTAGSLYAAGYNGNGELGINSVVPASSPTAVVGGLVFKKIKVVNATSMGLTTSGVLYAWGLNTSGILGINNSSSTFAASSPTAVVGGLVFSDFELSSTNGYAITTAGAAYAWGANTKGTIGDGSVLARSSPAAVLGGLVFSSIASDPQSPAIPSVLGLTTSGVLYAWGNNANGQLGVNSVAGSSSPVAVLGGLSVIAFSIFNASAFCVSSVGQVYGWGINTNGQLGNGNVTPQSSPVAVSLSVGANIRPTQYVNQFSVTPGSSLSVTLTQFQATLGSNVVGFDLSSLVVTYEQ